MAEWFRMSGVKMPNWSQRITRSSVVSAPKPARSAPV